MEPPQTSADEAAAPPRDPHGDLLRLVRSLRAHVEELAAGGAWGAPPSAIARAALAGVPSSDTVGAAPAAASASAVAPPPAALRAAAARAAIPSPAAAPAVSAPAASASVRGLGAAVDEPVPAAAAAPARPLVHLPLASLERLEAIANEARVCTNCGLHEGRKQSVFARGTGASGLVFIGEGPGEEEDRQGLPFVGPAGQLLDRMIAAMQLGRDDVYVCNIVKCRPPKNRKPEPDEMSRCMPFLAEQLSLLEPRVIVALGATAVQGLLGTTEGITRLRGQWKLYRGKIPVMPTFHPAYLLRTPSAKRDVWKDLQEVLRHLNGGGAPSSS